MANIPKEKFWELYKNLPQELKSALFAEETGDDTHGVCERNEIMEKLGDIVDLVGQVLVGVLAPEDFQETLEKELKLEKNVAKKVAQEINRFIFYPVRSELEKLYQTSVAVSAKSIEITTPPTKTQEKQSVTPTTPTREDSYREPLE